MSDYVSQRRCSVAIGLALLMVLPGCRLLSKRPNGAFANGRPSPEQLRVHINDNANRVQSLLSKDLSITLKESGRPPMPLSGKFAMEKPRNFRLTVNAPGMGNVADLGSNQREFWAYVATGKRPALMHASYEDLQGQVNSLPIQPEWILDSFGLTPLPENATPVLVPGPDGFAQIETPTVTPQGQPAIRVTIVDLESGWITEQHLEINGRRVASAELSGHYQDPVHGAVLPKKVAIAWPETGMSITVRLKERSVVVNPKIDKGWAEELWTMPRNVLAMGVQDVDLANPRRAPSLQTRP